MSALLRFPPYSLWETRTGDGTPVALLHGLSGSSRWWSRNVEALAASHLVAAVDLVGFGRNRRFVGLPLFLPSFSETTALLARWLETFGQPVHLIGHSMGGQIAIALAAERPDLVRSLVLVNAAGMPFRFDPRPHVRAVEKPPYGGPSIVRVLLPDFFRAGPASVAVASARVVRGDMREWMHAIRAPTLLVWGENDPLVPLVYGEAMQQEIAGSRLAAIPGAAHVAMWDAPDAFNEMVLSFLAEVESTPLIAAEPAFSWGVAGWTNGMAHRQAGRRRDIVLVHGLGMSSAYFVHLARALFGRGWNPIAPDIPGFGESNDAPPGGPREHALLLASWADALGIRDAAWLGHSVGCNAVAHLATLRLDLVRRAIYVGPLWTRRHWTRVMFMLMLDAFREPLALYRYVLPAYWRVGFARWWRTWRRFIPDLPAVPSSGTFIAGARDPLPDRTLVALHTSPGAHACVFSHPDSLAETL
ncbi:MAG TPA: alpha/beta fold hydrolase [Thermoanaerobaculia bacterium]|nr:alpha/beta fold hydrolase [Thermoanaerobaculia bacterium]